MVQEPYKVYSGAEFALPDTPSVRPSRLAKPTLDAMTSGAQAVHENISQYEQETYDRMEYTLDQQHKQQLAELRAAGATEDARRFNLPNGHKDGFYNENGVFEDERFKQYKEERLRAFDGLSLGYLRAESKQKASADVARIKASIGAELDMKMALSLSPRAKKATIALAQAQEASGKFELAAATISGAPDYALSPIEKQIELQRLERESFMAGLDKAVYSGDTETYLKAISNPAAMQKLTPEQQKRAYSLQRAIVAETSFEDAQVPLSGSSGKPGTPAKTTGKVAHLGLPQGVPDELVALFDTWRLYEDKDAKSNPEMQRQAGKALDAYAASFVTADMTQDDAAHFVNVASCFGIQQTEANAILEKYRKVFRPTKAFDFGKSLGEASKLLFTPRELSDNLEAVRAKISGIIASGTGEDSSKRAELEGKRNLLNDQLKDFRESLGNKITERYADWTAAQGDGKHLSDADRCMAFMNIMDEEKEKLMNKFALAFSEADDISNSAMFREADAEFTRLATAKKEAAHRRAELEKNVSATDAKRIDLAAAAEGEEALLADMEDTETASARMYAQVGVSFLNSSKLADTFRESYIAVPKGDQLAGKQVSMKVKGRTHTFECREADVDGLTFSVKAQASLGLLGDKGAYSLAYNSEGVAALVNASPPKEDFDMYRTIMGLEARRDKSGSLRVFNLPQADGGGKYEVAGINEKYHPQEAAKLKKMIEAGFSNEEVENEVMAYYAKVTQPGADLIGHASRSKGLELFMRDCAMNHGPSGAANVLRRAIGAGKTDNLSVAVNDYVARYGEQGLLQALIKGRAMYYSSIIESNPSKAVFRKGWERRLKAISSASYATLRQRSTSF